MTHEKPQNFFSTVIAAYKLYVCVHLSLPPPSLFQFLPFSFLTLSSLPASASLSLLLLSLPPLLQPFLGSSDSVNQVSGKIKLGKEVLATLEGHWVRLMTFDDVVL